MLASFTSTPHSKRGTACPTPDPRTSSNTGMPIVRIELFPRRGDAMKDEIAEAVTATLKATAGIPPGTTTVVFSEVRPADWFAPGESCAARAASN